MKAFMNFTMVIALVLSLAACNKQTDQAASTFDIEKVKPTIRELHQKFSGAFAKGDSALLSTFYHSDGTVSPPNMDIIQGKARIASFESGAVKMGITGITLEASEFWGNQDLIVVSGTYELKSKDGSSFDKGKYLELWKEENCEWKLFRDLWNSNMPRPDPAMSGTKK